MSRRKKGRNIDGVLLLDKPLGCSSNAALQRARRLFDARKAGHTGSLDPLASGLLPLCFGEATKLSSWLLHADKRYRVSADLRHETATGDREGEPTRYPDAAAPAADELPAFLQRFMGVQEQIPPMYSALKRDGRPLYELARAGVEVTRESRPITVSDLRLCAYDGVTLTLDVAVSRGTYVRTLVEDIARSWGGAAHVSMLRRTGVGVFDDRHMVDFETLEQLAETQPQALDQRLLPASQALADWPALTLSADAVTAVGHGRPVTTDTAAQTPTGRVRIMDNSGGFLGLGELDAAGTVTPKRMFTRVLG